MKILRQVEEALAVLQDGGVLAYPTEAVYGLGCDVYNQQAVEKILSLKMRAVKQGFIILISDWSQLGPLIEEPEASLMEKVRETWPGPVTWVFPKSKEVPSWLSGDHSSVAVRMSQHPIAHALCRHGPIVSTSANLSGQPPAKSLEELRLQFGCDIDAFLLGALGGGSQPTSMFEVLTNRRLR